MKNNSYFSSLSQSWKILWEHKILWVFGLFAMFLGQMGIGDSLFKFLTKSYEAPMTGEISIIYRLSVFFSKGVVDLSMPLYKWFALFWLFVLLFGLVFFLIFVAVVSQGAIIHSVSQTESKKKFPDFDHAWHSGVRHSGRLFFINLFKKTVLAIFSSLLVFLGFYVLTGFSYFSAIAFNVFLIVCLGVGILASLLSVYASCYAIVEEKNLLDSARSAWKLFLSHPLVSLEIGFILFLVNLFIYLILLAGFLFVYVLPRFVFVFLSIVNFNPILASAGMLFSLVAFTLFILAVGSLLSVYTISVWTSLFMEMRKKTLPSRIMILARKLFRK